MSDNFGYKVSAGYYEQDPYERPVIPGVQNFENEGTAQPKGDLRFDWDLADSSVFSNVSTGTVTVPGKRMCEVGGLVPPSGT